MNRTSGAVVLCLMLAAPAAAIRLGFQTVDLSGNAVEAQVCAFSAGTGSPIDRWFSMTPVRCFASSTVVAFPNGDWNLYALQAGRYASFHPYLLSVRDDPRNTDTGFKQIQIDLSPAATVRVPVAPGSRQRVALYFPHTSRTLAFAFPDGGEDSLFTVPLGLPFIPVAIEGGRVVRVGGLHRTDSAGEAQQITDLREPQSAVVMTYASVKCRPRELTASAVRDLPPPEISLLSANGIRDRGFVPLAPVEDGDLLFFRLVSREERVAELTVTGETWEKTVMRVPIRPDGLTLALPVSLVPAGQMRVTMGLKTVDWLRSLGKPPCDDPNGAGFPVSIELMRERGEDVPVRAHQLPEGRWPADEAMRFDQLPVGPYVLRVNVVGFRPVLTKTIVVKTGSQTVELSPDLYEVTGTVTRRGQPVRASVAIADVRAVTEAAGRFSAYLTTGTQYERVGITDCAANARFVVFPTKEARRANVIDVDLPDPASVRTLDRETSKPIPNALVTASVGSADDPQLLLSHDGLRTDEDGFATLTTTPVGEFAVCAEAPAYSSACDRGGRDGVVVLRLAPKEASSGSIVGGAPLLRGTLFFLTAQGVVTEAVGVSPGGDFSYSHRHGPEEFVAIVSGNRPLYLLPLPSSRPLAITLPAARVRSLHISGTGDDWEVGLAIGNAIVPSGALSRHQAARGSGTFTTRGELVIADIAETAPITVYRGFSLASRPPTVPPFVDIFATPELVAAFPRRVVAENTSEVVLP